jgi:hypothetical protein
VSSPNPALVTERAAQRLPRLALWLLCAAYLLPGLFGRDPWKNADITSFGYMVNVAKGGSWWQPSVGGLNADAALLPYGLGALFIQWFSPWLDPALAARIPFALLLGLVMLLTWYSTFHLARTPAAQPLPFAFGGEAKPNDYARAIADGSLLALIASLGLLQLGHETTPELGQLTGMALFVYALSSRPFKIWQSRCAMLISLPIVAASGAPSVSMALCICGLVVCSPSHWRRTQGFEASVQTQLLTPQPTTIETTHSSHLLGWVLAAGLMAFGTTFALNAWNWRLVPYNLNMVALLLRQLLWFLWPVWPLALWTLWRWRKHLLRRHIAVPLSCALVAVLTSTAMGGHDRALLLALPPLAVLAAFALPTLGRSTAAAIDWFSVFFFSIFALGIWVMYISMQTGFPTKPAANIAKLVVGFVPTFSVLPVVLSALGTLAWMWLVKWRTGRNRHPLWKSLVLPASGVALCWLMVMTLWLPLLDYARSYRPLIERIQSKVRIQGCVATPGMQRSQVAALEYFGHYQVDAATPMAFIRCDTLLLNEARDQKTPTPPGWQLVGRVSRPADRNEITVIYQRRSNQTIKQQPSTTERLETPK